jgi:hypothetical protein
MATATVPLYAKTKASGTGAPSSLTYGELATDGTDLWFGSKTNTPVKVTFASGDFLSTSSTGNYSTTGTVTATSGMNFATNFGCALSGSNALMTVDSGDAWYYDRTNNKFIAQVASASVWQVSANGPDNGVRRWYAETGSWLSTSDAVPYDNTVPTSAEVADTLLTLSGVNPKKTTNKVMIKASGTCTAGAAQGGMFFLFKGSDCIAARAVSIAGAGTQVMWSIEVETTFASSADVTLRYGVISSGTMYVNGTNTAGLFGGICKTTLEAIEHLTA